MFQHLQTDRLRIFKIWQGGPGIWGAIFFGGVGAFAAYIYLSRSRSLPAFRYFADAVAPGIVFAQAIGRWGNWFNAELFGKPTNLPWGLEIPLWARPIGMSNIATYHPTFLYESLFCFLIGLVLLRLSSRLRGGQIFSLYVLLYCVGRFYFETLRIDYAHHLGGIRINVIVALCVAISSAITFRHFSKSER